MGSLPQPNKFIPYKQNQGNYHQTSLSGSETDVSTSNENLSSEEKYVIRHTARQEPQGQENLQTSSNRNSLRDSITSNRSSLDVSSSSYNTLIIHNANDEIRGTLGRHGGGNNDASLNYVTYQSPNGGCTDPKSSPHLNHGTSSPSPRMSAEKSHSVRNSMESDYGASFDTEFQQIHGIPDDYLGQSSLLKQLAKEVHMPRQLKNMDMLKVGPLEIVPNKQTEFSKWSEKSPLQGHKSKSNEKAKISKSQPDLSAIMEAEQYSCNFIDARRGVSVPRPPTKGREEQEPNNEQLCPSAQMVELLSKENSALKLELDKFYQRVAKTEKLEQEIFKVYRAHEELVQSCDRRERLERAARAKFQNENRKLQEYNRVLREQIDMLSTQMLQASPSVDNSGREVLITQLITKNKELVAAKERQEIELAAQRATLQEQRTHIAILDTALTNAQGNVVRLEEESRKKQAYVERAVQLQKALNSLQLVSDRREQTERKLRLQLEMELQHMKSVQSGFEDKYGWNSSNNSENVSISELKRQLREKDEKIMRLEGDGSKWEQRYLEESALRQAAIDAASLPKDAKIAALEKTSQETEKIIAEARNEKIRQMDEVHAAQKKVADLESRIKDLESKLAEKDAMIRVLQKHTYDKEMSSMLGRSPHHTPHGSLASADIGHVLGSTVSREDLVSSVLTSSTGFGSGNSYAGSDSSYRMPSYKYETNKNFDSTKKTLDNQLKEIDSQLDSQLLSKRALCCFPGFTNPVTSQRKAKLPKPLLGNVNSDQRRLFEPESMLLTSSRNESGEILLLERQGRASQQQRMQDVMIPNSGGDSKNSSVHCPSPSSLPRPPRAHAHRSGLPRRLGEYNRLGDNVEMHRKKSDGGDSLSSGASSRRASPARSLIPSPRKFGEYGRLSESGDSSTSLRKADARDSRRDRDSTSTLSDNSASSLPIRSKIGLFGGPLRRGSSLGREGKSSDSSTNKYRIQF